ncbi:MAG: tryptophan--tRNA ligase [Bacteriovoracaceae bacterium]|nr:tryptophan--tRNA ligase [Bacteriovoracaceae bacterium]
MTEIIVSGMRPTGSLHLGHYVGVIKNWLKFQEDYESYFFLADWHAVTSNYHSIDVIKRSRHEYVKGWLACGVSTDKAHIYNQSDIPEILNLAQFFLTMTPPGWADRSPSWKDLKVNPNRRLDNLGFYTYPILQSADIAIVRGNLVPIGEDQLTHLEISREIIRKFNRLYHTDLPEPSPKLTKIPKLLGIDGAKMSSSTGNVITLQESPKSLQKKINKMKTDETRAGIESPGNPDNCSVFDYHKIFSTDTLKAETESACKAAQLGCGECKKNLGQTMKELLIPIADKMSKITDSECDDILAQGKKIVGEKIRNNWNKLRHQAGF